ncbi:hypothetical protein, partial [Streptomyces anulatus]
MAQTVAAPEGSGDSVGSVVLGAGVAVVAIAAVTAVFTPQTIGIPVLAAAVAAALFGCPAVWFALRQRAQARASLATAQLAEQRLAATVAEASARLTQADEHTAAYAWEAQENS